MFKKLTAIVLAVIMLCALIPTASAGNVGMENFKKTRSYSECKFTDVLQDVWYTESIKAVFEYGIVRGKDDYTFDPDGNINIAETLTFACRIHKLFYQGNADFVQPEVWYDVYVDYAVANGIIESGEYSDMAKKATRAEFASILVNALPRNELAEINYVTELPDVSPFDYYYDDVMCLYRAGVLTGNDERGTFTPDRNITRAEVAAIVTRMMDLSLRKEFTFKNYGSGLTNIARYMRANGVNTDFETRAYTINFADSFDDGSAYTFACTYSEVLDVLNIYLCIDVGVGADVISYDIDCNTRSVVDNACYYGCHYDIDGVFLEVQMMSPYFDSSEICDGYYLEFEVTDYSGDEAVIAELIDAFAESAVALASSSLDMLSVVCEEAGTTLGGIGFINY